MWLKDTGSEVVVTAPKSFTPLSNRVHNLEAMTLGFVAENSLSLSIVPRPLELMKVAVVDKKALNSVSMDRTSASYKMRFGLAKTMDDELTNELKNRTSH